MQRQVVDVSLSLCEWNFVLFTLRNGDEVATSVDQLDDTAWGRAILDFLSSQLAGTVPGSLEPER